MPDELKDETVGQKRKLPFCGMGIAASLLMAFAFATIAIAASWHSKPPDADASVQAIESLVYILGFAGVAAFLIAPFLGLGSIVRVCRRTVSARSLLLAIPPAVIPPVLLVVGFLWLQQAVMQGECGHNLRDLTYPVLAYSQDNYERYPDPNKWCDLLIEKANADKHNFRCQADKIGPCSYAINPDTTSNASPSSMVLLFESKPGWNQYGGPELLDPSHHRPRGCHVLFNDFHVEFVPEKDLPNLRWTKEQKPPK